MYARIANSAKAILAALIAGLGALSASLVDNKSLGDVTDGQWVAVAVAFFVALGAVYGVPNRPPA